ncbi:F-box only protein 5 [Solea solea]|uniref:F-box only protein 5 n=1 Tax=Solea solea TaxID=90069 RepID=UPI00272C38DB|nr:F-box only protein 5 [Solea solea]
MRATMKCPHYNASKTNSMEKSSANVAAADYRGLHLKTSPVKEPIFAKPQCPPAAQTTVLFPLNDTTGAIHNKENSAISREHDGTLDEGLEDSGYLSLHNSRIDEHHGDEEDDHIHGKPTSTLPPSGAHQEKTVSPHKSPSKCQRRTDSGCHIPLVAASTPVGCHRRRLLSSTPSDNHSDPNLPILKFQRDVCEKLTEGYRKNKRFDWSIVAKVAEDHILDRVIGGHMGLEYVDIFASLLSRNMRSILANILALLGDMDLISCKKVSKTWRRIICEDNKSLNRCREPENMHRESTSPLSKRDCGLTRDVAVSRVVLSCMQSRASASKPASSSSSTSQSCRVTRRTASSQKGPAQNSQCTRFNDFVQAAGSLKQHESLRPCKRCGSPATHSSETQRAICTRSNCGFDFCTCCQEAYHTTPCRTVQPRPHFFTSKTTPVLPGSARSKRNIRRL